MISKNHTVILIQVLFFFLPFEYGWKGALFAQYIGGNADGHSMTANETYVVPACSPPSYFNVSKGGNADGHSMTANETYVVPACSPPSYFNVSKGGNADGHSMTANETYVVPACLLPSYFNVSKGGNADGHSTTTNGTCYDVVPIELLYFTAILTTDQQVLCQWATATEINNDYFTIEKTKEGINYEVVGKMKGAGNSTSILDYSILDENPYSGTSYYRLKQTDYDGKYEYSRLVAVNLEGIEIIIIYPNPANTDFEYLIGSVEADKVQVLVIDAEGRKVLERTETINKGLTKKSINISALSTGSYILQIITRNNRITQKQFLK